MQSSAAKSHFEYSTLKHAVWNQISPDILLPPCHHFPLFQTPLILITSISKTNVAFGGMPHAGNPPGPYPISGARVNLEPSPFVIVKTPRSQPRITDPVAALKLNGCCPGSLVLQNFAPPWRYPVHSTVTVSPWRTGSPIPGRSISFTNPFVIIWAIITLFFPFFK